MSHIINRKMLVRVSPGFPVGLEFFRSVVHTWPPGGPVSPCLVLVRVNRGGLEVRS